MLGTIAADVRYAFRMLRKSPGFTAVAVLSLALGIGANTAIFSLIDAVLLTMLPVSHPEQLVNVRTTAVQVANVRIARNISRNTLKQMQEQSTQLSGLAAYQVATQLNVGVDGRAELSSGHYVSGSYFSVLGVRPILGRTIQMQDDRAEGRVALISYGYWQRRFGGDPGVIGRSVTINNVPFTIIGVTPREFYGLSADTAADLMLPSATKPQLDEGRMSSEEIKPTAYAGLIFGRLKKGANITGAAAGLSVILRRSALEDLGNTPRPEDLSTVQKLSVELTPGGQGFSSVRNRFSKPLQVLMAVVGLVMLIACANIANLLLAKASIRQREMAVRLSIGSSRRRLFRQLFTESLVLSILGGGLGILFAIWAKQGILYLATTQQGAPAIPAGSNLRVLTFTAAACLLNAILFGMAPAFRAARLDLAAALKSGRIGHSARSILSKALVSAQVALSLALLIGAGLFAATFRNLDRIDLGFSRDHSLLLTLDPHLGGYRGAQMARVYQQVTDRVAALPGVQSASLLRERLLTGRLFMRNIRVPGYLPNRGEDAGSSWVIENGVGARFFAVSGMKLLSGRDFSEQDDESAPRVAVINETMARHFFGGKNPIGQRIAYTRKSGGDVEVVGIVRDIRYVGVRDDKQDVMFTPFLQDPDSWKQASLLIRTSGDPARIIPNVRAAITGIDGNLPVYDVITMDSLVESTLVQQRLLAILSSFFGLLALGLSAIGLYGVLSYGVSQRTGEIGIRMALGAERRSILRMILKETALLSGTGMAAGIWAALASARLIQSMLYGVTATDPAILVWTIAILSAVALVAGLLPARRAANVEPMVALRHE